MTIERVTEAQFRDVLRRHFTPARPISSTEYLRGRETKLRQIDRASTRMANIFSSMAIAASEKGCWHEQRRSSTARVALTLPP